MAQKLLIITGVTASGKTSLAAHLASRFGGELLDADSRHVYRGLSLLTGKDIPSSTVSHVSRLAWRGVPLPYYAAGDTRYWLVDMIDPDQVFDVSFFHGAAKTVIDDIHRRARLPIVVGGTGLYVRSLTRNLSDMHIPPDPQLRERLASMPVAGLQEYAQRVDAEHFAKMNHSDRQNPRRLVRAIEIGLGKGTSTPQSRAAYDTYWIGLRSDPTVVKERIRQRIESRWTAGVAEEVKRYLGSYPRQDVPAATALGLSPLSAYLHGDLSVQEAKRRWFAAECDYAKRQEIWFRKEKDIVWFDSTESSFQRGVEDAVRAWYTRI